MNAPTVLLAVIVATERIGEVIDETVESRRKLALEAFTADAFIASVTFILNEQR